MAEQIPFNGKTLDPASAGAIADDVLIQGARPVDWWRRQGTDLHQKFMDTVRQSMEAGEGIDKLRKRIAGGTLNGAEIPGIMKASRANAETLARTAVNKVSNEARLRTFEENPDIIKGIKQVSTLDNRTSITCIAYDGQAWSLPDYAPIPPATLPFNNGPPRHFNCRSTTVPILKSWQELGIPAKDLTPSTRASMDGQLPADQTFDGFLKKKGKAFQDKLLGPVRAKLWRSGKITLQQMLDFRGQPLEPEALLSLAKKAKPKPKPKPKPAPTTQVPEFADLGAAEKWISDNMVDPANKRSWGSMVAITGRSDLKGLRVAMQTTSDMQERFGLKKARFIGDQDKHPFEHFTAWESRTRAAVYMEGDDLLFKQKGVSIQKNADEIKKMSSEKYRKFYEKKYKPELEAGRARALEIGDKDLVAAYEDALAAGDFEWTVGDAHFLSAEEQIRSTFIHENGHRLHQRYRAEIDAILSDLSKSGGGRFSLWQRQTSKYATKNAKEFIAEQFVQYVTGHPKRVPPPLLKFFKSIDKDIPK